MPPPLPKLVFKSGAVTPLQDRDLGPVLLHVVSGGNSRHPAADNDDFIRRQFLLILISYR